MKNNCTKRTTVCGRAVNPCESGSIPDRAANSSDDRDHFDERLGNSRRRRR